MQKSDTTVGFIGQGWIGKHYADAFEERGYEVVRYALEEPYKQNKDEIPACDITFIAVPTPTTQEKFDDSIVREVVGLVGEEKIAVIKSTLLPGTTTSIQDQYPGKYVLHSPEFLTEKNAAHEARNPSRNIVGVPEDTQEYKEMAKKVIDVLPDAPFDLVCSSKEAEFVKYAGNTFLYLKVMFANLFYDLVDECGADWETVREGMTADARIGDTHLDPVHQSHPDKEPGRGAGGDCFIKDFAAIRRLFSQKLDDSKGKEVLEKMEAKNIELLCGTNKDIDLLQEVYGDEVCNQ